MARLEHRAILESLAEIEALSPGIYEMKIDNPTGDSDCRKPQYAVQFEERRIEDLKFVAPYGAFERAREVSEKNERLYAMFLSPVVRAFSNPWTAAALEWLHPMRASRYLWSEHFSPWMRGVAELARMIEARRRPLAQDHPAIALERAGVQRVTDMITAARKQRDAIEERAFAVLYGAAAPRGGTEARRA